MDKKPMLGSDPLEWIRDTRKDSQGTPAERGEQNRQCLYKGESVKAIEGKSNRGWGVALFLTTLSMFIYVEGWGGGLETF